MAEELKLDLPLLSDDERVHQMHVAVAVETAKTFMAKRHGSAFAKKAG